MFDFSFSLSLDRFGPPMDPPDGYYFESREQALARRYEERMREDEEDEEE